MINNLSLLIKEWFSEDIGDGDHSSFSCIPENAIGTSVLLVKEPGIIAGVEIAKQVFAHFDDTLQVTVYIQDGTSVLPGDIVFRVRGKIRSLLQTERLMLNIMQRMSGVATVTHTYSNALNGLHTKVLDTRKTTPGLRMLEKMAVKIGGGQNHRFGLYDMIMLKDNHIDYSGGITQAIQRTNEYLKLTGKDLKIEIEVRNLNELDEVLAIGSVNRIMLDNFTPENISIALAKINGRFETEASGGITKDTLLSYAKTGVDFISVGALTHSYKSLDLSLKATFNQ